MGDHGEQLESFMLLNMASVDLWCVLREYSESTEQDAVKDKLQVCCELVSYINWL